MPENVLTAGIAQTLERAEIGEAVRDLIEQRGHDRRNGILPTAVAESLSASISEYLCERLQQQHPWSRSSRPELARYFEIAIQTVEAAESADDMPAELLSAVLGNVSTRLDNKLAQISDPAPPHTTKESHRV